MSSEKEIEIFTNDVNDRIIELWKDYHSLFIREKKSLIEKKQKRIKQKPKETILQYRERLSKKIDEDIIKDFRVPLLMSKLPSDCQVLFIGLNPSFSAQDIYTLCKNSRNIKRLGFLTRNGVHSTDSIQEYFIHRKGRIDETKKCELIAFENAAQEGHQYFRKFEEIAREYLNYYGENDNSEEYKEFRTKWAHIDLFHIRETNAGKIKKYLNNKALKPFFDKQVQITIEIIEKLNPKIILVANALASRLVKEYYSEIEVFNSNEVTQKDRELYRFLNSENNNYEYVKFCMEEKKFTIPPNRLERIWIDYLAVSDFFESKFGTYTFPNKLPGSVFFFSGMLSGQRALDLDSYRRLKWHIMQVKDKMN